MPAVPDPTTTYARRVIAGKVLAGRMVRLACVRHLRDLKEGPERGLRFDKTAVLKVIRFFEKVLCFSEGDFAGKPFKLEPWQKFILGSLFGWYGKDGHRRFRNAYVEIAKGNGKSPMAGGIGLYGLVADGVQGAQIYSAAVVKDQAKILWRDADNMVKASPELSAHVDQQVQNLAVLDTHSFFRPVSSEYRALEGLRVHMGLIDEVHEHPNDKVYEKIRAGTKGFQDALILEITNCGFDKQSICWQHHLMSEQVLSGVIENDAWFAYICQLDACEVCAEKGHMMANPGCENCDDWRDERVWKKANPNLGVSIPLKYLREQVAEAKGMPSKQNTVLRLNFCIWTEQATRWLDMTQWMQCAGQVDERALEGRMCYGGLDLASTRDLCALALVFPPSDEEEPVQVIWCFWVPEDTVKERVQRDRVPYDLWVRQGHMMTTEGNVADYDVIRTDILHLGTLYNIRELAIDRWNSTQLQVQLVGEGVTVVPFGMGFVSMTAPSKELERLVFQQGIAHGNNPAANWAASNVAVEHDSADNIKPNKEKSTEKIDPITALIMAIGRMIVSDGSDGTSVYEQRGMVTV